VPGQVPGQVPWAHLGSACCLTIGFRFGLERASIGTVYKGFQPAVLGGIAEAGATKSRFRRGQAGTERESY